MGKWPLVKLGEVLRKSETWIALHPEETYKQITVKLWGKGVVLRGIVAGAEIAASQQLQVKTDQFILSRIDARNGALGLVPSELDGGVVSNDFPVFDVVPGKMLPSYMGWLCKTRDFVDQCRHASEGTTNRVRLKEDRFLEIPIPLPPLAEQRRIVAKIDALAAKIDEVKGLRKQAGEEAEAVVGSAARLLFERVDRKKAVEEIAVVQGGLRKSPDRIPDKNPIRYITVAHVQRNRILWEDPRFFEISPSELPRYQLLPGDVLIIEGNGSADQIGRTALYRGEATPCVHQNHVIRIRPRKDMVTPEYLNAFLNSPAGQDEVKSRSRTTSGLLGLSIGRIRQIDVPVPPLPEQRHIVARLDALQAQVDALKQAQAASAAELDALLPSILDRAFKGEG